MHKWLVFFGFWMGCGSSPIIQDFKGSDSGSVEEEDDEWGSETTGDAGSGADADADADGDDGSDGAAPLANPTITLASAVCLQDTTDFWKLKLIASDPQGLNTLSATANCDIYPAGATDGMAVHSVQLGCALGDCSQNYSGEEEGVLCDGATEWEFRFTISDEDGYFSTPEVVIGSVEE